MNDRKTKKTVFVGLSGGVDSSVAAARLIKEGYNVVGVFIKVWQPDFLECNWEEERLDAMRVAAHLKIPFLTCDAEAEYKKEVGEYFVNEYLAGRTPNPDVMCNRYVKFGVFWRFAKENGADFIATGHYAQKVEGPELWRGVDHQKDQSYFLWTLTKDDLEHVLFPVGNSEKEEIRKEAEMLGLPTAMKKDSQGICFLGHVNIKEFLSHFTNLVPGKVIDVHGETIGTHDGALIYTLGQRQGFHISGEKALTPHFVVAKDIVTNTVVVDTKPPEISNNEKVVLDQLNLLHELTGEVRVQMRYRQEPVAARVLEIRDSQLTLEFVNPTEKPASGQSIVFYQGQCCLGGGVVI